MIKIRTEEEIELLRVNALLVSKTLAEVGRHIAPGVSTKTLDAIAEAFIRDHGAEPAFLGYDGFPATLCISLNSTVVHGIPSDEVLKEGDVVSIDCGTRYKGYCGDSAYTFGVGELSDQDKMLLRVTHDALFKGIEQARSGNRVGDISAAVQSYAEQHGFSVVREMVGHGIGTKVHERPDVPNYGARGRGKLLSKGMVICIEPMINAGAKEVYLAEDGWALQTADDKKSAHFELTMVVREREPEILSTFNQIDEYYTKYQT
ncbi:MAG: type I methionyl aminopeptidase [Prevotellaceae bacterium]|jgi:methionyl aminopeptidase|nr:type I methionyl aminopeptidase [Prevotellaceae bacterium]